MCFLLLMRRIWFGVWSDVECDLVLKLMPLKHQLHGSFDLMVIYVLAFCDCAFFFFPSWIELQSNTVRCV